jgi:hypothetical protein
VLLRPPNQKLERHKKSSKEMMEEQAHHNPDSVSFGGGGNGDFTKSQPQPSSSNGLNLPDIIYGFMLILSNVSALLAFTVQSNLDQNFQNKDGISF